MAQAQLQASQVQLQQAQLQQAQVQQAHAQQVQAQQVQQLQVQHEAAARESRARANSVAQAELAEDRRMAVERHAQEQQFQQVLQQAQQAQQQQILQQQAHLEAEATLHLQQQQRAQLYQQQQQMLLTQQQQQQQILQDAVQQAHFSAPAPFAQPFLASSAPTTPTVPLVSTPVHLQHAPHTPSPLSIVVPAHAPLTLTVDTMTSPLRSAPVYQPAPLLLSTNSLPAVTSTQPPELNMLHQQHSLPHAMDAIDSQGIPLPLSIAPELLVNAPVEQPMAMTPQQDWAYPVPKSPASAHPFFPSPTLSTAALFSPPRMPASSPPPPPLVASLSQSRPPRSRAASGSVSTSRSRAASGSGFQSLLESRSRAASSASSAAPYVKSERDDDDEDERDEFDYDSEAPAPAKTSTANQSLGLAGMDDEMNQRLDPVFTEFLEETCSDCKCTLLYDGQLIADRVSFTVDATDAKGEAIHQTLMAKKMEKLDASTDFRPFKFRIQAFTNAFAEKLASVGLHEDEVSVRRVRQYLWAQPFISRFNDDGKKSKVSHTNSQAMPVL